MTKAHTYKTVDLIGTSYRITYHVCFLSMPNALWMTGSDYKHVGRLKRAVVNEMQEDDVEHATST